MSLPGHPLHKALAEVIESYRYLHYIIGHIAVTMTKKHDLYGKHLLAFKFI